MGTPAGEGPLLSSPAERRVIPGREVLADARTSAILAGINEHAEHLQALLERGAGDTPTPAEVERSRARVAEMCAGFRVPDYSKVPTPTKVVRTGPYRSTPYFEGGWMILGPEGEQIGHSLSVATVHGVTAALNDAYRHGLAEGGAR